MTWRALSAVPYREERMTYRLRRAGSAALAPLAGAAVIDVTV